MQLPHEKILKYGTYLIVMLIPWITFARWVFTHMTSKAFIFYGIVSVLVGVWVYALVTDARYRLSKKTWLVASPLIIYVAWMTIAGITGHNFGLSVWGSLMRGTGLLTLYTTTVFALMIASLSRRYEGYIAQLIKYFAISGMVVATSVWFGDEGFGIAINVLKKGSGGGVMGNSTLAGAYLLVVLGFTAFLLASKSAGKKSWLWALVTLITCSPLFINIYGLLSGASALGSARAALIGIIAGSVVAILVYLTLSSKKLFRALGIGGIVVGIVGFVIVWHQLMTPGTSIHQKFIDTASGTRFAFWEIADKALAERPLLGYGPENFPIAQAKYFDPQFLSKSLAFEAWTDHPHNIYYDNAVAGGYPAIVLYAVFIASLGYSIYRNKKLSNIQKGILIGTVAGYLLQDLFSFDGFTTIFTVAVLAGIVYGYSALEEQAPSVTKPSSNQAILWLAIAAAVVGVYYLSYLPAHKAKLYASVLGSKLDERYLRYQEFLKGSPVGTYWDVSGFAYDEYKLYARDPFAVKQDPKILPYAIKDVDAYIAYLEEVTKTNKTDYRLYFSIINLYNTKIYLSDLPYDPSLATHIIGLIDHAQTLAPTDPRLYWLRAQLAAWRGDLKGVIAAYEGGIAIDPTLSISHKLLLQFLQGVGNQKLYKQALTTAQTDIPGFVME